MNGDKIRLTLRLDLPNGVRLGPGKISLLAGIAEHGSIRAAGATMGMSYRRAWLLADEINRMFKEPSIFTRHGGKSGGGAGLTPFGESLLERCRKMEAESRKLLTDDLSWLEDMTAPDFQPAGGAAKDVHED
ncbi:LysR family transcriptional regulator [Rhizobium cremeum]|uniref:winged helix-turn-helix domain-containing protein n=1 Tax=Rhizobium cremeum TaxID=2813827 RepID=UPI000DE4EB46|nr:LysR family transcriptional regulator [Rhizobium cremeum]MCJ7996219.1 LysR family transcriptional regulator [Rhizobium cremeum]MCJ8001478.1 LysR family transcriptional regulator [Rhizobium cremeum]